MGRATGEPSGWDCHDRRNLLATLFERRRERVVTGASAGVAVDDRVYVEVTGPRLVEWGWQVAGRAGSVTVRDGRIVRMQDYRDRAAALAGAGPPPEARRGSESPQRRHALLEPLT